MQRHLVGAAGSYLARCFGWGRVRTLVQAAARGLSLWLGYVGGALCLYGEMQRHSIGATGFYLA